MAMPREMYNALERKAAKASVEGHGVPVPMGALVRQAITEYLAKAKP